MAQRKPNLKYDHPFAIVRKDGFHHDTDLVEEPGALVNVKKIVWSREVAESEDERLNRLKAGSEIIYFSTIARVERRTAQRHS